MRKYYLPGPIKFIWILTYETHRIRYHLSLFIFRRNLVTVILQNKTEKKKKKEPPERGHHTTDDSQKAQKIATKYTRGAQFRTEN